MIRGSIGLRTVCVVVALCFVGFAAEAVDVEKKFRVGLYLGSYDTADEVASASANTLVVLELDGTTAAVLDDPRNDSAAFGALQIKSAPRAAVTFQYAFTKTLVLEGLVGYQSGDVGEVEVQGQYTGVQPPENQNYLFDIQRIPAGTMEQIPIQISALARFRPRANFNPYFGGGIGYTFVGFEVSDDLNVLSTRLDDSRGAFARISSPGVFSSDVTAEDLVGAEILAPDYWEWHLVGGAEYSIKRKWAVYVDVRYIFATREAQFRFNSASSLGIEVANTASSVDDVTAIALSSDVGPYLLSQGGLVDGGQIVPDDPDVVPEEEYDEFCGANSDECSFVFVPDGIIDTGHYYVQGGTIKYGGWAFALGFRYTF